MVDIPDFMKLMECECGWTLYSMDAQPVECPKCYTVVVKRKTDKDREKLLINTINRSV
jgi:hypothetical protein